MNTSTKTLLFILFLIAFTSAVYLGVLYAQATRKSQSGGTNRGKVAEQTPFPTPTSSGQVEKFTGKISCLPLKDGSFENPQECAMGLLDDSGKYYALLGLTPETLPKKDSKVEIQGSLIADFFNSGSEVTSNYSVTGGISITSINKI